MFDGKKRKFNYLGCLVLMGYMWKCIIKAGYFNGLKAVACRGVGTAPSIHIERAPNQKVGKNLIFEIVSVNIVV